MTQTDKYSLLCTGIMRIINLNVYFRSEISKKKIADFKQIILKFYLNMNTVVKENCNFPSYNKMNNSRMPHAAPTVPYLHLT